MDLPSASTNNPSGNQNSSNIHQSLKKDQDQNVFTRFYSKFIQQKNTGRPGCSNSNGNNNPNCSNIQSIQCDSDEDGSIIENKICVKFIKMAAVNTCVSLYKEYKTEWNKPNRSIKKCGALLDQLKVALVGLVYLPTGKNSVSQQELNLARDILESGAEYSVAAKDIPGFERYMSQLKCYYYDYKNLIGESQNMYQLLGLNLLFLLSQNRVAEFHTELELLPADIIHTNKFIRPPLILEQYLMEGSYNKIFQAKGNVPAESYNFFMDILLDTVRNEIGACLERAYEKISIPEAGKRLNLKTDRDVKEFATKRNWKLGSDNFYHFASETPKQKEQIPSLELAEQVIFYARELEMIV